MSIISGTSSSNSLASAAHTCRRVGGGNIRNCDRFGSSQGGRLRTLVS